MKVILPAGSFDRDVELDDLITETRNFQLPAYQSSLTIGNTLTYKFTRPVPSRWHQFWYRVLLGWTWTDLTKKETQ